MLRHCSGIDVRKYEDERKSIGILNGRAYAYCGLERFLEAADFFREAIEMYPSNWEAMLYLIMLLLRCGSEKAVQ